MTDYVNQHFVPQFYFKLFTLGDRRIHVLLKKDNQIKLNASIKGQCARHKFYGNREIEKLFSKIEGRHSAAINKMLELAWPISTCSINVPEIAPDISFIWEAVLFQRARTELRIKKDSPAIESMCLELLKNYIEHEPGIEDREKILEHISSGEVCIKSSPQKMAMLSIDVALKGTELITDLNFYILRNHTSYPFIFSDSPVIFYNTYYQNVENRGVLGTQTPGLQVFYPLDSRTLLMLIDDQTYEGRYKQFLCVDIIEKSDVSQLNALQLHHSYNTIYFADEKDKDYVSELWSAHKHSIVQTKMRNIKREDWLVDGKHAEGVLYHMYEPQLNIKLSLSFVACVPIDESEYIFRKRNPRLVKEVESRLKKREMEKKAQ